MPVDPRLELARRVMAERAAASQRGVVMSPMARRAAVSRARPQEDSVRSRSPGLAVAPSERAGFQGQAQQEEEPTGFRGLAGTVLGNPLVRGVLKPLELLDTPRRLIISGLQEGIDAVNGGDASWSDFTEQVADESFGFGDVVGETGNKWLDRAIGFVGDVALDPTTYLTAGTSKFLGTAGRAALDRRSSGQGHVRRRVGADRQAR